MADLKERRREVANRIRVKASPMRMTKEEFHREFVQHQVVVHRDEIERFSQEMFCDNCTERHPTAMGEGIRLYRKLHAAIEDDPLGNFWKLVTLRCFGCGFSEIVPLDEPKSIGGRPVADVWKEAQEKLETKQKEELYKKEIAKQQAAAMKQQQQIANQIQPLAGAQNAELYSEMRQLEAAMKAGVIDQPQAANILQRLFKKG